MQCERAAARKEDLCQPVDTMHWNGTIVGNGLLVVESVKIATVGRYTKCINDSCRFINTLSGQFDFEVFGVPTRRRVRSLLHVATRTR